MNYLQVVQLFRRTSNWSIFDRRQHTVKLKGDSFNNFQRVIGKANLVVIKSSFADIFDVDDKK
jgi:hypothetical protein